MMFEQLTSAAILCTKFHAGKRNPLLDIWPLRPISALLYQINQILGSSRPNNCLICHSADKMKLILACYSAVYRVALTVFALILHSVAKTAISME